MAEYSIFVHANQMFAPKSGLLGKKVVFYSKLYDLNEPKYVYQSFILKEKVC